MSGVFNSRIALTRVVPKGTRRKVTATVFPSGDGEFSVRFWQGDLDHFDEAGPFGDEHDAMECARRGADEVRLHELPAIPVHKNHEAD